MTKINEDLEQRLLDTMRRFHKGSYLPFRVPEGLTPSEASIVVGIYAARREGRETIQPRFLSEHMHMTPSALSQMLKMLEEKGYVERHRISDDFRAVSLELTKKGTEVAQETYSMRKKHLDDLVEYIGADDLDHLIVTLNRILDFHEQQASGGAWVGCPPCHDPKQYPH